MCVLAHGEKTRNTAAAAAAEHSHYFILSLYNQFKSWRVRVFKITHVRLQTYFFFGLIVSHEIPGV